MCLIKNKFITFCVLYDTLKYSLYFIKFIPNFVPYGKDNIRI